VKERKEEKNTQGTDQKNEKRCGRMKLRRNWKAAGKFTAV